MGVTEASNLSISAKKLRAGGHFPITLDLPLLRKEWKPLLLPGRNMMASFLAKNIRDACHTHTVKTQQHICTSRMTACRSWRDAATRTPRKDPITRTVRLDKVLEGQEDAILSMPCLDVPHTRQMCATMQYNQKFAHPQTCQNDLNKLESQSRFKGGRSHPAT